MNIPRKVSSLINRFFFVQLSCVETLNGRAWLNMSSESLMELTPNINWTNLDYHSLQNKHLNTFLIFINLSTKIYPTFPHGSRYLTITINYLLIISTFVPKTYYNLILPFSTSFSLKAIGPSSPNKLPWQNGYLRVGLSEPPLQHFNHYTTLGKTTDCLNLIYDWFTWVNSQWEHKSSNGWLACLQTEPQQYKFVQQ